MWNKILYVYGDNFGWLTVTRLGSYVALQKVKHHKKQYMITSPVSVRQGVII
jgi:hypothetical protein